MFTGIITDIGTIERSEDRGDRRVTVATSFDTHGIDLGASIACSGACMTVVDKGPCWFAVDVSAESIRRTAPGMWEAGARLNLERAMKLGEELGGHIVTGHVDGLATIVAITPEGESHRIDIAAPRELAPYLAPKGSVTLDGVSLTVNEVRDTADGTEFTINLIPHTQQATTLGALATGKAVNIEIDVLARYLSRMEAYRKTHMKL